MELSKIRLIALIEGSTLLLLLFVAMPLKYKLGMPMAVSVMMFTSMAVMMTSPR